jgi:hypothetical protein
MIRQIVRTLILLAAAGIVMGAIYIPVRWVPAVDKFSRREEAREREYRARVGRPLIRPSARARYQAPTPLFGFSQLAGQFLIIAVIGLVGRKVLRLRLKR